VLVPGATKHVTCVTPLGDFKLDVHQYQCGVCDEIIEGQPAQAGCFPACLHPPHGEVLWLDNRLLDEHRLLFAKGTTFNGAPVFGSGSSMPPRSRMTRPCASTANANAKQNVFGTRMSARHLGLGWHEYHRRALAPMCGALRADTHTGQRACVCAPAATDCDCAHVMRACHARRATHGVFSPENCGAEGLPKGPAKYCFVCCGARRVPVPNGLGDFRTPMTPAYDGWFKPKMHTGNKVDDTPAVIKNFVGSVNDEVQKLEAEGMPQEEEDDTPGACSSEFSCPAASRMLKKDVLLNVVIGAFCAHYFPLCQLFVLSKRGGACLSRGGTLCSLSRAHTSPLPFVCSQRRSCPSVWG
jgi:hypothetical protein